jgi:hypothetical protein
MKLIKSMEELPAKVRFSLPNWDKSCGPRATAWAYLNREDGGPFVESESDKYSLDKGKAIYKNSFYNKKDNNPYSPENFTYHPDTGDGVVYYKGFIIYARWDRFALCYDIVKDGVCVSQMAGPRGAKDAIDKLES